MKTNQAGIDLIKSFEGLRLNAYKDAVGVNTIGYGTTRINGLPVSIGESITPQQAEDYLRIDLNKFETDVSNLVRVKLTDNQFAALVSFTYNLGAGNLAKSTLLRRLNSGDYNVGSEFLKWNKAGGRILQGLVRRRAAEKKLFET